MNWVALQSIMSQTLRNLIKHIFVWALSLESVVNLIFTLHISTKLVIVANNNCLLSYYILKKEFNSKLTAKVINQSLQFNDEFSTCKNHVLG